MVLSFDAVYREFSAYVAYIGIRILGRQEEIDDLVQDVFVEALRGLGKLKDAEAIKGWLATVTARVATRRLRLRKVKRFLGWGALASEPVWPGASPEQAAEIARIYERLERVPAKHRIAWVLRMVEREPLADVAAVCGCSIATAKRWVENVQQRVASEPLPKANA